MNGLSESNKRYYWLKLKEDFFEDDTIRWLEEQDNGKEYVIFYLKLALKSLDDNGKLVRYVGETLLPYDIPALARLTNTHPDTVAVAMKTFESIGLISKLDNKTIYMNQIEEMVGSETAAAEKMRRLRAKRNDQKLLETDVGNNVTGSYPELLEIEKELEIERERELEVDNSPAKAERIPYKKIISYLNEQAGRQFNHKAQGNQDLIKARWNEGYNLDDFKKAIDNKVAHAKDPKHFFGEEYLRPSTLFRKSNFDEYVNAIVSKKAKKKESEMDFEELQKMLNGG